MIDGSANPGEQLDVWFGIPGRSRGHKVPRLPSETERDYFVILYFNDDEKRRLAAFPIDEREYEEWWKEYLIYDRERSRPGARDG